MYLLIDWGNTRLKFLLIKELLEFANQQQSVEPDTATSVKDLVAQLEQSGDKENVVKVLIASVRSDQDNQVLAEELNQLGLSLFIAKTSKHACSIECAYQNPQLLGIDRWHEQEMTDVADHFRRAYMAAAPVNGDGMPAFEARALLRLACRQPHEGKRAVLAERLLDCAEARLVTCSDPKNGAGAGSRVSR